jgi:metal-responsive CopG/Arc/MetJ family transcriptional regulator
MKTIAVTIDEPMLQHIDRIVAADDVPWKNRSAIIRQAVREFVAGLDRQAEEERERVIFRRQRERLNRQATALVKEQANI